MVNNSHPHSRQFIFSNQENHRKNKDAHGDVGQDKGHFPNAPRTASQPAPFANGTGARALNTKTAQIQKTKTGRAKRIHSTFHIEPGVRFEMERIAKDQGLSFSEVCNVACRFYANATIEKQHAESLKDVLRQIVREELEVFGHRIIDFLMRIALSAEQAKLLSTNILKFVLKLVGVDQKTYVTLVDESGKIAKRNVRANTQQIKSLVEDWEGDGRRGDAGR